MFFQLYDLSFIEKFTILYVVAVMYHLVIQEGLFCLRIWILELILTAA